VGQVVRCLPLTATEEPLRSLQIRLRSPDVETVLSLAARHHARSLSSVRAERTAGEGDEDPEGWSLVLLTLPNDRVGTFIDAVGRAAEDAEFVLLPVGVLPLGGPSHPLDEQVRDVSRLSTLELVVSSLQSIGSWRGMVVYSVLAGTIAAYALIFDVSYLLVAAMLINPMGAPAQVAVIGQAIGDVRMFFRGGERFLVSLLVQAGAAMALGFAYGLRLSTPLMEQIAALSAWTVLIALAAGAAGAQSQVRSERDSLVSGTAAGFMVAAALAPPAAMLGLAISLGRWDYAGLMAFLLALQFLAINVGGGAVLFASGIHPARPSVGRGSAPRRAMLAGALVVATIGLVVWQSARGPAFAKADLSRAALEIAQDAVGQVPGAHLIDSSARFTRRDLEHYEGEGLLIEIVAESSAAAEAVEVQIRDQVRRLVAERMTGVIPFVRVSVIPEAVDVPE